MKSILTIFLFLPIALLGQGRKNTLRYNVSNPLILGVDNIIIGYEHIVKPYQSFVVNFGVNHLPSLNLKSFSKDQTTINLTKTKDNPGYHFSMEYRLYLPTENKFKAPRGIYVGPYYSFNSFSKNNYWFVQSPQYNGDLITDIDLKIHTIGVEMGYQFVLSDRIAADIIFLGPGLGNFDINAKINGYINAGDKKSIYDNVQSLIAEKIPGYNFAINPQEIDSQEHINVNRLNYRFMVNVGYRF